MLIDYTARITCHDERNPRTVELKAECLDELEVLFTELILEEFRIHEALIAAKEEAGDTWWELHQQRLKAAAAKKSAAVDQ